MSSKIALKQSCLILLTLFSFVSNTHSQGKDSGFRVNVNKVITINQNTGTNPNKKVDFGTILNKPQYLIPTLTSYTLKNVTNQTNIKTKTYTSTKNPIVVKEWDKYEVTFVGTSNFGVKSISFYAVTTGPFDGEGSGTVYPKTETGKPDSKGSLPYNLSVTVNCTVSPVSEYVDTIWFYIVIEDANGQKTKEEIELDII